MSQRNYSSVSPNSQLASGIAAGDTSVTLIHDESSFPAVPFTLILDVDTVNEEIVDVTAKSGSVYTITRAVDGTTAKAHSAGAGAVHGVSGRDFADAKATEAAVDQANGEILNLELNLETLADGYLQTASIGSASFTPAIADAGKLILGDQESEMTVTLPSDSTAGIGVGARIDFLLTTAQTLTFAAGADATVNSKDGAVIIDTQYGAATAIKVAANSWVLVGGLA